jgi:hypothetical protein
MNTKEKMIGFLLENANPSIKRRIKTEILNNITTQEAVLYQGQILAEPNVKQCLACQHEDGWFGNGFHGTSKGVGQFENQETCTKYLGEKAVDKDTPALKRSMEAFATVSYNDPRYGTRGKVYQDEFTLAAFGMNLISCACIARAGYADTIDISPQIQLSLDSFNRVLEVDSVLDVSRPIRHGKLRVFNDNEKWPCRYHLDILAHTDSWRSEANIRMIADSVIKMMKTDRPELVGVKSIPAVWVGYPLGPLGAFPSQGLSIMCSQIYPTPVECPTTANDRYQFEYIEWFARCGIVPYIPALREAVQDILNHVDSNGICRIPEPNIFKGWGPYGGLQLEVDWKSEVRKACDVTFRALLICHYANM